ncbi:hypothetical protein TPAR_08876 [Tolypocladium paradoxum]|uniref:Uncharacterized protein n=1 Tax=Tolypocladium paradoxum TaxID=94208 RepID=A0A2S4KL38_9HYPO|nr:hypothetical protein TPAR_08876 [Tolypocladium paradoxum]
MNAEISKAHAVLGPKPIEGGPPLMEAREMVAGFEIEDGRASALRDSSGRRDPSGKKMCKKIEGVCGSRRSAVDARECGARWGKNRKKR